MCEDGRTTYLNFNKKYDAQILYLCSFVSGSSIPAFRQCLPSRCLAMDACLRLHYCGFEAPCHNILNWANTSLFHALNLRINIS
jgi:hypothetical protein